MNATESSLPLVVQLGFSGSRHLLDTPTPSGVSEEEFLSRVQVWMTDRLRSLHNDLGLAPQHFLCGISQIAAGADTLFTHTCKELDIPQRIFLPGHRDEYLNAKNSSGNPDFSAAEQNVARSLLASPHIIEERVVSDSTDRRAGFEDANLEIVQSSDLLVCLIRAGASGKPGGTYDLIALAASRNKPVLEITVGVDDGGPTFAERWQGSFTPPVVPPTLVGVTVPRVRQAGAPPQAADYFGAFKEYSSAKARKRRTLFTWAALFIIGSHVLATICAVIALEVHGVGVLSWFLTGELVFLSGGLMLHQHPHRFAQDWAVSRLLAELNRSVLAVGELHVHLDYLVALPFPEFLKPILRTFSVLHLLNTRVCAGQPWQPLRDAYVHTRLTGEEGQLKFFKHKSDRAGRDLKLSRFAFVVCSLTAVLATLAKLFVTCVGALPWWPGAGSCFGAMAIIFPVLAVAAISLAAAFDVEARHHTFREMFDFTSEQIPRLEGATSEREFAKLLLETESRLLGETATWFSRRSFS